MSDYFTHLARRTVGIATGSDARPIRSPRAAIESPRPVLYPQEVTAAPSAAPAQTRQVSLLSVQGASSFAVESGQSPFLTNGVDPLAVAAADAAADAVSVPMASEPLVGDVEGQTLLPHEELRSRIPDVPRDARTAESDDPSSAVDPVPFVMHTQRAAKGQLRRVDSQPSVSQTEPEGGAERTAIPVAKIDQFEQTATSLSAVSGVHLPSNATAKGTHAVSTLSVEAESAESAESVESAESAESAESVESVEAESVSSGRTVAVASARSSSAGSAPEGQSAADRSRTETGSDASTTKVSGAASLSAAPVTDSLARSPRVGWSEQKASPPEVHIHIGRIEVRSPQVVQSRPAPAEPRPTLSLRSVLSLAKGK